METPASHRQGPAARLANGDTAGAALVGCDQQGAAAALMHASGRARASLSSRQAINQARRTVVDKINAARGREISSAPTRTRLMRREAATTQRRAPAGGGGLSATELDALHQLVGSPKYLLAGELPWSRSPAYRCRLHPIHRARRPIRPVRRAAAQGVCDEPRRK